ncbi:parafibromin-like [Clytia hemisphaerica]|uniref:Parafibromin n=1 Tax=Clytia hemisphaerica TaxID=252671 RepID=A0A7M5V9K7_9CNID
MADPLTLLRQFNTAKKHIVEREDQIVFETISFFKTAKTNYVIGRTTPREYYTLEALLFLLKNVQLSHPIYVQRAGAANVPVVRFPDRKDLLAYLNGEKDQSANVDKSAPLELPISRTTAIGIKRSGEDTVSEASKKAKITDTQNKKDIQEWLQNKLNKKEGAIITDDIKEGKSGLNEVMSIDRIAEIKRKIMTRKRGTIKGGEDYNPEVPQVVPMESNVTGIQNFVVDADNEMTKDILNRERHLRTRTSVLQSNGKQFLKNILAILTSIKAQEEGKSNPEQQPQPAVPVKETRKIGTENRYDRFYQERFDSQKATEGFKIDTMATFHGLDLQSVKEGKSQRRNAPAPSPHNPIKSSSGSKSPGKPQKRESKTPIIIVPSGTTALISLLNAKDILQDYRFVSVEEKKRLGTIKENEVMVQRKKDTLINNTMQTVTIPFRIVDQPLKLQPNEWNRVAAVFVQGPTWQFKGWPHLLPDGSPVDILTKIKGFHVRYDDMKTDANVMKWDVMVLTFNRNRRHMDRATVLKFWEALEKFLAKNKPNLRF